MFAVATGSDDMTGDSTHAGAIRVATFNASLNRDTEGELVSDLAYPVCGFHGATSRAKASGGSPACRQSSTATVWDRSLRSHRPARCQASRARTCLAW